MEVALEEGGVDDLQQFLAALNGGRALHKGGGCRRVGVVQLLY